MGRACGGEETGGPGVRVRGEVGAREVGDDATGVGDTHHRARHVGHHVGDALGGAGVAGQGHDDPCAPRGDGRLVDELREVCGGERDTERAMHGPGVGHHDTSPGYDWYAASTASAMASTGPDADTGSRVIASGAQYDDGPTIPAVAST